MKLLHLNLYSKGPFLYSNYPRKTYMQSLLEACTSFHCFMKNLLIYKVCLSNASVIYEAFIIIFADWGHVGNIICATGMMLRKQKWIHPPGCVTAVSFCTILAALQIWNSSGWFVLVNVISAQNERGVFYILLYVFLYLRANFGALFSAVVTGTGNFICLLVCWHSYPNVNLLPVPVFPSHWKPHRVPCMARRCCAGALSGPRGDLWGPCIPAELYSSHLDLWDTAQSYFVWMKETQYSSDISCKFISLAWGRLVFTRSASDKFVFGKKVPFVPFSVSKGRKAKDPLETIKHFSLVSCLD